MRIDFLQMLFGEQLDVLLNDRAAVFDLLANGGWQQKCGALTLRFTVSYAEHSEGAPSAPSPRGVLSFSFLFERLS